LDDGGGGGDKGPPTLDHERDKTHNKRGHEE
jgi:hypothetical protein